MFRIENDYVTLVRFSEQSNSELEEAKDIKIEDYKEVIERSIDRAKRPGRKKINPHYLSNAELYNEVVECKKRGEMSDKLCRMLQLMCDNIASRWNFFGYTYIDEAKASAMLNLVIKWDRFDHEKYNNAFAYYTRCILNAFSLVLRTEKEERVKRDKLLVEMGMDPSLTYQMDTKENPDEYY